jgi:A/G-specific adenine glycosylase
MATTGEIQKRLLEWYERHRRVLPWRGISDPYAILVAEVMLQQTGVERVRPIFERFLAQFPTIRILADAPRLAVLRAWAGLGYNRRAVNLHECAKVIVNDFGGELPRDPAALRRLPGVGPYTEAAIRSFVFHEDVAAIDTNVLRVVGRVCLGPDATKPSTIDVAAALVPSGASAAWNQALMDLGATICTVTRPNCAVCPLIEVCASSPTYRESRPLRSVAERSEPYLGSRRYLRGRIVAVLRRQDPECVMSVDELARTIVEESGDVERHVVEDLARRLASDGLARVIVEGGQTLVGPPV